MSRNWTKDQNLAINTCGTNIIVSAGAGSGKTAVLTERVITKLKKGISINNLLILTFTEAAASEMKDRIRKAISENEDLKDQLALLESSYITTFDSYALSVVRKYHYLLNVSPNVGIISSDIVDIEKKKIIDDIFDEYYAEKDDKFLKIIHDFCLKDDNNLKDGILGINKKLDLKSNKKEYLEKHISTYYSKDAINNSIDDYLSIIKNHISLIHSLTDELSYLVDGKYYTDFIQPFNKLYQSDTLEAINDSIDFSIKKVPKNADDVVKSIKGKISDEHKKLKKILIYQNENEIYDEINLTKDLCSFVIDVINKLDHRIEKYKNKLNAYEFNDIALMAIKIVRDFPFVQDEIKNNLEEILVDEYQDTNDIQEEFISLISNNNVYMVGDIKQSIYMFRNANPYIFKSKYDLYSNTDKGVKIDLIKNFRSRHEVLDGINDIFKHIMSDNIGGANYIKDHMMLAGNITYDNEGKNNENNNLEIYNYQYSKDIPYKKEEIEAFFIANDIKNKINQKYPIFDKSIRPCKYSDFVILLEDASLFELYKKIFMYLNIPLAMFKDESIKSREDILIIKNLYILASRVYNKTYDVDFKHAFVSVLRSYLFSCSDQEIFDIVTNNSYYDTDLFRMIKEVNEDYNSLTIASLLDKMIDSFHFYDSFIKIGNVKELINRLDYIKNKALELTNLGYTIDDFIDYLDEVLEGNSDIRLKTPVVNSDSVKIMTIHKSKGLEFPICYYAMTYKNFNLDDVKGNFLFDNKYGIILPYYKDGIGDTVLKILYKNNYIKENISEKIRLFYVALTRAKEKMIIVSNLDDNLYTFNGEIVNDIDRLNYNSLGSILSSVRDKLSNYIKPLNIDSLNISNDYILKSKFDYNKLIPDSDTLIDIRENKVINSEIKTSHFSKEVHELIDRDTDDVLDLGTKVHYLLEVIDFKNPNLEFIDDDYIKDKIKAFLNHPILDNIKNGKIMHEYEFIYDKNDERQHGIIDLMIEYDDYIDIIDYKLKNISDPNYQNQVNGYKEYIKAKTNKKVYGYLYSIIDEKLEEVI